MKYLRKLFMLLLGIAFFVALIICVGRIFAVRNINVNLITYEEDSTESYNKAKQTLSVYKGESMLFFNENEVAKKFAGSNYVVTSCEKKFPCTLNVTIKERLEIFAVSVGGLYSMYDGDGRFLRSDFENANDIDGTPNVEISGVATEQLETVASIAQLFKSSFGGLRSIVESINLDSRPNVEGYSDKLIFNLRCGLVIQFNDYSQEIEEKILAAYRRFSTLSDKQKLSGKIVCYRYVGENSFINANYSP